MYITDVVQPEETNRWKSINTHTHAFIKYAGVIDNFSLIKEAVVDIYKETGSWLLLNLIQIITEPSK